MSVPERPAKAITAPISQEQIPWALDAWKQIVDVQKHFNELEQHVRNFAITVLVAFLGATGLVLSRNIQAVLPFFGAVALAPMVLLAGCVTWLMFWAIERFWYYKLLIAAVRHGQDLEAKLEQHVPGIGLATRISVEVPRPSTERILDLLYWSVGIALFVLSILLFLPTR